MPTGVGVLMSRQRVALPKGGEAREPDCEARGQSTVRATKSSVVTFLGPDRQWWRHGAPRASSGSWRCCC